MTTNKRRDCKELTSDQLFGLLATLPEDVEADHDLVKRGCCRWLLRAPAELYYTAQNGTEAMEYASIRDVCITGIGLLCKKPLPAGSTGELVLPMEDGYYKVNVKVAHCTQTVGGYRIGCQLLLPDGIHLVPMVDARSELSREYFERNGR